MAVIRRLSSSPNHNPVRSIIDTDTRSNVAMPFGVARSLDFSQARALGGLIGSPDWLESSRKIKVDERGGRTANKLMVGKVSIVDAGRSGVGEFGMDR
jgi:hypothetical protein